MWEMRARCIYEPEGDAVRSNRCSAAAPSHPSMLSGVFCCQVVKNGFSGKSESTNILLKKKKKKKRKTVFLILWFLTPTPSPRYLSFYVGRLRLPGLAPLRLTYFFFHFDHLSHLHKQFCFCDWSLSLMEAIGFFFYSSPSARMPTIRDPYIH